MDQTINVLYVSLSGNTKCFINKIKQALATSGWTVNAVNIRETPKVNALTAPFVTFLPAFLKCGNGTDNGFTEILTTPLRKHLDYQDNYRNCYVIIGSGNRNFNNQFALTTKQYADDYGFPYLTDFELRGTVSDVERIGQLLIEKQTAANALMEVASDAD